MRTASRLLTPFRSTVDCPLLLVVLGILATMSQGQTIELRCTASLAPEAARQRGSGKDAITVSPYVLQGMKWDIQPILAACGVSAQYEHTPHGLQVTIPVNAANQQGLERFLRVLDEREGCLIQNIYNSVAVEEAELMEHDARYRQEIRAVPTCPSTVEVFVDRSPLDLDSVPQFPRTPGSEAGDRLTLGGFIRTKPGSGETLPASPTSGQGSGQNAPPPLITMLRLPGGATIPSTGPTWALDSNIDVRYEINELRGVVLLRRDLQRNLEDIKGVCPGQ
jgi:hypothetical protein